MMKPNELKPGMKFIVTSPIDGFDFEGGKTTFTLHERLIVQGVSVWNPGNSHAVTVQRLGMKVKYNIPFETFISHTTME